LIGQANLATIPVDPLPNFGSTVGQAVVGLWGIDDLTMSPGSVILRRGNISTTVGTRVVDCWQAHRSGSVVSMHWHWGNGIGTEHDLYDVRITKNVSGTTELGILITGADGDPITGKRITPLGTPLAFVAGDTISASMLISSSTLNVRSFRLELLVEYS
jgi:hypothetical protein